MRWSLLITIELFSLVFGCPSGRAVSVYNPGTESCGTWTSGQNNEVVRGLKITWVLGFVSAYNIYRSGEDVTSDVHGLVAWVDNYCLAYPLDPIARAAGKLIDELRRQRGLGPMMH
jgi:hypothetical protein